MALVIYPNVGYDSFVTVVDADTYIDTLTLDGPAWIALTVPVKENYLRIATRTIIDGIDQTVYPLPDPAPACLGEATALIASWDLKNGLSASAGGGTTGEVKRQKVSTLEIEYFQSESGFVATAVAPIPDMAKPCLEGLGFIFVKDTRGIGQVYLGRM